MGMFYCYLSYQKKKHNQQRWSKNFRQSKLAWVWAMNHSSYPWINGQKPNLLTPFSTFNSTKTSVWCENSYQKSSYFLLQGIPIESSTSHSWFKSATCFKSSILFFWSKIKTPTERVSSSQAGNIATPRKGGLEWKRSFHHAFVSPLHRFPGDRGA